MNDCDYCGQDGCHWTVHPEAHHDVAAWAATARANDNE